MLRSLFYPAPSTLPIDAGRIRFRGPKADARLARIMDHLTHRSDGPVIVSGMTASLTSSRTVAQFNGGAAPR